MATKDGPMTIFADQTAPDHPEKPPTEDAATEAVRKFGTTVLLRGVNGQLA